MAGLGDCAGQQGFSPRAVIGQQGTMGVGGMQAKLTEVEFTFNYTGLSCMSLQLDTQKSEKLRFHTTLAFCESWALVCLLPCNPAWGGSWPFP